MPLQNIARLFRILVRAGFFAFLSACICSCGKEGPPRLPAPVEPLPPASLSSVQRENEIVLRWRYPENKLGSVSEFIVMKSEGGGKFRKTASTRELHFIDREVKPDGRYEYKIIVKPYKGKATSESNVSGRSVAVVPGPPNEVSFAAADDSVVISWRHPSKDVSFNIYKRLDGEDYPLKPLNDEPFTGDSFTEALDASKKVFYTIRAVAASGIEGPASGEVEIGPDTLMPSAPRNLQAYVIEDRVVILWQENPERWVRGYKVYRSLSGGEYRAVGESKTPAFTDFEVSSVERTYKITAVGPLKEGPFSEPLDVAPMKTE